MLFKSLRKYAEKILLGLLFQCLYQMRCYLRHTLIKDKRDYDWEGTRFSEFWKMKQKSFNDNFVDNKIGKLSK